MKSSRTLQLLSTRYFVVTALIIAAVVLVSFSTILASGLAKLDDAAKFTDAIVKMMALLIASLWALNRYYIHRTDFEQLRVDADVDLVAFPNTGNDEQLQKLLIYRLDIVNTGKSLLSDYTESVTVDSVHPDTDGPHFSQIHRWPESGHHPGSPIEPGSWAAINDAICVPATVRAVRILVEIQLDEQRQWTWHKTFALTNEVSDVQT